MNKYESFVGKVLDGRYKILELVGLGGMACVLKAQDLVMNRVVAIKILNDELNGNQAAEARFIDESKAVAMLSNKNIVGVYDVAIYPDIKYIVMEYLDGITLREYLDNKGAIEWKEACIYILQILRALEHAHSKGIIHRDIKPQNVMLMKNGDIKVTDFGIAKLPDSVSEQNDEKAVGTVYYISPEQACGKQTDFYSDIYSVGIMFYEAVTGKLPFTAETPMEIAMMQVNAEPVHPRDIILDIPVGVSQIILKAMEKSPDDRFRSAHTMAKAIEWILKYPDVIFAMNGTVSDENTSDNNNVVSIEMISTAELEPYGEEDISDSQKKNTADNSQGGSKKSGRSRSGFGFSFNFGSQGSKRSRSMFPIIFGISLAFFIVLVGIIWHLVDSIVLNNETRTTEIETVYPDIFNMTKDEAISYVTGLGYAFDTANVDFVYLPNTDENIKVDENCIYATVPPIGDALKLASIKTPISFKTIYINSYETVMIPDLLYLPKTEVVTALKNMGLVVEVIEASTTDNIYYNAEQVIDIYPEAGEVVGVGETVTVTVYVPDSDGYTKMPNVIGLNQDEARTIAESYAKYDVTIVEDDSYKNGNYTVVKQSVAAGTSNPQNTSVILTVAVPPKTFIMPDLKGLNSVDAMAAIKQACPDTELNIAPYYYTLNNDQVPYFMFESIFFRNFDQYINLINEYVGFGLAEKLTVYDGKGTVYIQSIPAGEEVNKEDMEAIKLFFLTYDDASATPPSSGSGTNTGTGTGTAAGA